MWFIKFLFKLVICFIALILLVYFIFLSEKDVNLAKDPLIKKWIGSEFEIQNGIYICKYKYDKRASHHLEPPNTGNFPPSTEAFLIDPEKWAYFSNSWYRPIFPGTKLKITQIIKHVTPAVGTYLIVKAVILSDEYKNFKVSIESLFEYDHFSYQIFGPKENFLRQLN